MAGDDKDRIYRKSCKRHNIPGDAHSLTFSCFRRQPFLSKDRTRTWLIDAIERARTLHAFDVWAYVIMPEHVHLVIYPTGDYSISRILTSIKQPVAKRAAIFVKTRSPAFEGRMLDRQPNGKTALRFWQRGGGYDRNLESPALIWETIDYIHANPVRRRLCDSPANWVWSSAAEYSGLRRGPLAIQPASLPWDPRRR